MYVPTPSEVSRLKLGQLEYSHYHHLLKDDLAFAQSSYEED